MLPHIVTALDILNVSSPTSLPNCPANPQDQDMEDGIKSLHVPVWDDKTKEHSTLHSTNHDISLTWSDSLLDASDHSYTASRYQHTTLETGNTTSNGQQQQQRPRRRRQSKEQLKRRHQLEADLLVEKTFVHQLRQSEEDYMHMSANYENQLRSLQNQLIDMQRQRDLALGDIEISDRKRKKNNSTSTGNHLNPKGQHRQQQHHVTRHVKQSPIAQQIKDLKLHYESQLQRLISKNQEWERKHTQALDTMSTIRTQADQVVQRLHSKIQQLQTERNQLEQAMKHDNARLRRQLSLANQEIQQLKKNKDTLQQKNNDQPTLKTKNHQYIQQINMVLRKAADNGVVLSDTFTLAKRSRPKACPTTCLQHSPPPSPTTLN